MERDTAFNENRGKRTWAQSANLTTGDANKTLTLQTGDLAETGYGVWTVMFGVSSGGTLSAFTATATVNFVVNGIPFTRVLTVGQGTQISGPADSISVRVVDATPAAVIAQDQVQNYSVAAAIVPGTRVASAPVLLQDPGGGIYGLQPGGIAAIVSVPANSGVVGAQVVFHDGVGGTPAPNLVISMAETASTVFSVGKLAQVTFTTYGVQTVYFTPGTTTLVFQNNDVTNEVDLWIAWIIDG